MKSMLAWLDRRLMRLLRAEDWDRAVAEWLSMIEDGWTR